MTKKLNTFNVLLILSGLIYVSIAKDRKKPKFNFTGGDQQMTRDGRALSIFQVVRFPNSACSGSSSKNGTCFTSSECTAKGGINAGSCASGFGVCCTFTLGCGSTSSQNCTYFESSGNIGAGQCAITICKCSSDICQLRIDMNTFMIAGPNTLTASVTTQFGGSTTAVGGAPVSLQTQCNTDTFTVTGPTASVPPVICGTNSGSHVYVDASNSCNTLAFQLGQTGIGTTIPTRSWSLKITQISCYDNNLAPPGCTQYYYGSTTGMVNSFNYANSNQLANQNQNICIRRERGYCRICWSAASKTDFSVSAKTSPASKGYAVSSCCGYGTNGVKTIGYDCVMIPGASSFANKAQKPNHICGNIGLVTNGIAAGTATTATVCSMQTPFELSFLTDNWTMATAKSAAKGFKLTYWETTC